MPIELELVLRLLLAGVLGAIIGFQREKAGKAAGLRTLILVSVGAALFTIVSFHGFGLVAEQSRIAAGIVVGIGFLGTGAILRRDGAAVEGLTTAATIWAVAGIGMAAGVGLYIITVVSAALILIVLFLPHPIR
jgi:putative Mg2+ transporter-C (MgtC) family protein